MLSLFLIFFLDPLLSNNFTMLDNPYAVALDKGVCLVSFDMVFILIWWSFVASEDIHPLEYLQFHT